MKVQPAARAAAPLKAKKIPDPFHAPTPEKVIDPTGGGNGFLGGLAIGLVRTGDVVEASKWGNVAASFMIEQVGVPVLQTEEGKERWNGVVVEERMKEYSMRCI